MRHQKTVKQRLCFILLTLLFLIQTGIPRTAFAAGNVYFTAVNKDLLDLTDATMPFWSEGLLYVPSVIFANRRKELGLSYSYNAAKQILMLYSNEGYLTFDLSKEYAEDKEGNLYFQKSLRRGGILFLPVGLVATQFGLKYSFVEVPHGHLVWIRSGNTDMKEELFIDASQYRMEDKYNQYLKSKEPVVEDPTPSETPSSNPTTPIITTPITPPATSSPQSPTASISPPRSHSDPEEEPNNNIPEEEIIPQKQLYFCIRASESGRVAAQLDVLDALNIQAAFYCTLNFLEEQGELLRRMIVTGHSIGLILDTDQRHSLEEQAVTGNRALFQATCSKTRLLYLEGNYQTAQTFLELENLTESGYCCFQPNLDWSEQNLTGSFSAPTLLRQLSGQPETLSIWLSDISSGGLQILLTAATEANHQCFSMTEVS